MNDELKDDELKDDELKDDELYVVIKRSAYDYIADEVPISEIKGVKWDNISGGVYRKQAGYSLYGYIPYSLAMETVKCSGMHNSGYNSAKICIPASLNKDDMYKEGYKRLRKRAGDKPTGYIKKNRPEGGLPCTRRILAELEKENNQITRKKLRDTLTNEGYQVKTVCGAINRLRKQSKIEVEGSPNSPNQIIKKSVS